MKKGFLRPRFDDKSAVCRYSVAVLSAIVAVASRYSLNSLVSEGRLLFVTVFAALVFVAWFGGVGPAIVTMVLSTAGTMWFLLPKTGIFSMSDWQTVAGFVVYGVFALLCIHFGYTMRRAHSDVERHSRTAQERDRRLIETFESITDAFTGLDQNWKFVYVNAEAERLLGRPRNELIGRVAWDVFPELVGSAFYEGFTRAAETRMVVEVEDINPLSGQWFRTRVYPSASGVSVYFQDVTQRKHDQEALRQSEARYRGLTETGPQMTFVVEAIRDGKVLFVSPQIEEFTGVNLMGMKIREANELLIHPEDLARLREAATGERRETIQSQFRFRRRDGQWRWVQAHSVVLPEANGGVGEYIGSLIDIHDQKTLVEKAQRSADQLHSIADSAPLSIAHINRDHRYLFVNEQYAERLGFRAKDLVGKHMSEVLSEPAYEVIYPHLEKALKGEKVEYETEIHYPGDYGRRWVHASYAPQRNSDGEVYAMVAIVVDITQRREAEEAIRQGEERYRAFIANSTEGIWRLEFDPPLDTTLPIDEQVELAYKNGRFAEGNQVMADMYGVPSTDDLIGTTIDYMLPYDDPLARAYIASIIEAGYRVNDIESTERDAQGNVLHFSNSMNGVIEDGKLLRIWGTQRDITERRRANLALAESEEKYRTVLSSMADGFCIAEIIFNEENHPIDFRYLETNSAFYKQTGLTEVVGRTSREIFGEAKDTAFEHYVKVALTGQPTNFEYEVTATQIAGWYEISVLPIGAPEQRRIAIFFRNITERKRVEQALYDADRRKDEFLATLAHELRNPLAPISNSIELLKWESERPGLVNELQPVMKRQVSHMVRLVDDLLDLSRITRDKLELRKERVALKTVIQSAVDSTSNLVRTCSHRLQVSLPLESVYLDADVVRLAQVFGNLLTNSCKYTNPGGRIEVSAIVEGNEVLVTVADNGMGIPQNMLTSVFEMFIQVDRSLEKVTSGLGIGLHLVKRLVELHGGSVSVTSAGPNLGSQFLVRLPILLDSVVETPSIADLPQLCSAGKVLVVDDNVDAAITIGQILRYQGFDTEVAHDGLQAVQKSADYHPDVILLDIGLPKMNGYEACQEIRKTAHGKCVFIVALTGWGQEEDRQKSKEAGVDAHLVKPVDVPALLKLISESLPPPKIPNLDLP